MRFVIACFCLLFSSLLWAEPELNVYPLSEIMPPHRHTYLWRLKTKRVYIVNRSGWLWRLMAWPPSLFFLHGITVIPQITWREPSTLGVGQYLPLVFAFRCKEIGQETQRVLNMVEGEKWVVPPLSSSSLPQEYIQKLLFDALSTKPQHILHRFVSRLKY